MNRQELTASSINNEALAFSGVSLTYAAGEHALCEVDFTISHGETVALCGSNGSGKTTLLKLACGLLTQTSGSIRLAGEALDARARKAAFRRAGLLFQDSEDQLFCATVGEDIAYGPLNLGLPKEEVERRVREALEVMQITHLARRPIHHLSGGEKKRAALAGLLAMRTGILLFDEPTSGLDPAGARELIATLNMLNREFGHTLIVATHEIDRIPEFARRVIILKDGAIYRDGQTNAVLTDIDALQQIGLDAPIIARYFYRKQQSCGLGDTPLPTTIEEALALMELNAILK